MQPTIALPGYPRDPEILALVAAYLAPSRAQGTGCRWLLAATPRRCVASRMKRGRTLGSAKAKVEGKRIKNPGDVESGRVGAHYDWEKKKTRALPKT